jgi:DNA invertase Pin-like site-specific DNA recombinase
MSEKTHYLYLITREDGEQYIGVTCEIKKRMYAHRSGYGNKNLAFKKFSYEILEEGEEHYIYSIEESYIQKYKCSLNRAKGGNCGPQLSGEDHGNALLSEKEVLKIKELLLDKKNTYSDIARKYQVSESTISNIANNKTWTKVGPAILSKRKPSKISSDTIENILNLWNAGNPRSFIVKELGVSKTSVYEHTKNITPLVPTRHANSLSAELIDRIKALSTEGLSVTSIAKELNISKTTVGKYMI